MTAEEMQERIVEWLQGDGFAKCWGQASFSLRLKCALLAFRAPWALAQGSCRMAAQAIASGQHLKEE